MDLCFILYIKVQIVSKSFLNYNSLIKRLRLSIYFFRTSFLLIYRMLFQQLNSYISVRLRVENVKQVSTADLLKEWIDATKCFFQLTTNVQIKVFNFNQTIF